MDNSVLKLYLAKVQVQKDRRQNSQSVEIERRTGLDRRLASRIDLDKSLEGDYLCIKSKVGEVYSQFKDFESQADSSYYLKINADKRKIRHDMLSLLSPIVPFRRLSSLPDNIEDGNFERAAGLVALALVNLPEDTRDLKSAARQLFKGELPNYDYKNSQVPFSFFRGTALEPIVNKTGKIGEWLYKKDVTLYDTKLGASIAKLFGVTSEQTVSTGRTVPHVIFDELTNKYSIVNINVEALKFENKIFSKLVGRALLRIPVISIFTLGLLELPSIIKSFKKSNNTKDKLSEGATQIVKSGFNVASIISCISLFGALFAKKGPAGSLIGMGIGSCVGTAVSKFAGQKIDKLKST